MSHNEFSADTYRALLREDVEFLRKTTPHQELCEGRDRQGRTALVLAPWYRFSLSVFLFLINEIRVPLEARDTDGNTALHLAVIYGRTDYIVPLLKMGAIVDSENNRGETPFKLACYHGVHMATILAFEGGADSERWREEFIRVWPPETRISRIEALSVLDEISAAHDANA